MQALHCGIPASLKLWHVGLSSSSSLVLLLTACGILVPGLKSLFPTLEGGFLITREILRNTFSQSTLKLNTLYYVIHPWPGSRNIREISSRTLLLVVRYKKQENTNKTSTSASLTMLCVDHNKLENSYRDGNTRPPDLPL